MIRVTIDMVPGGVEDRKYNLHVIEIANDALTTIADRNKGSYNYRISRKIMHGGKIAWHKTGKVLNFPRSQKNSVHLLYAVLKDAYESK